MIVPDTRDEKNMTNITLRLGAAILGVFLPTAVVAGGAYAFGDRMKFRSDNTLKTAIEKNDYGALGQNPTITEDQFKKLVEAYGLAKQGKYQDAQKLLGDAGLNNVFPGIMGRGGMKKLMEHGTSTPAMKFDRAKTNAVKAALDAGDYDAWLKAVGANSPIAQKINKDNFSRYVEAYNHVKQAQLIVNELGLTPSKGMGVGWPDMMMGPFGWFRTGMGWLK
jgi:hypothetical protein